MAGKTVDVLLEKAPQFHNKDGASRNFKAQTKVLRFIEATLQPGLNSLETGCGYSTVVFAAAGGRHTSVTVSQDEPGRVREFCQQIGVDTANLSFAIGKSFQALPALMEDGPLHYVFIDGGHGFPHPCVDWLYTEPRLEPGGYMLVDDVRIPTCRMLHDYMAADHNYRLEQFIGDTSVFRKLSHDTSTNDWKDQGYNRNFPDFSFLPLAKRIKINLRNAKNAIFK